MSMVKGTSNRPQHGIGNHSGFYILITEIWRQDRGAVGAMYTLANP